MSAYTGFTSFDLFADSFNGGTPAQANLNEIQGTASIFNKFSMFRYHRYGPSRTAYDPRLHLDSTGAGTRTVTSEFESGISLAQDLSGKLQILKKKDPQNVKSFWDVDVDNPTAKTIIEWSKKIPDAFAPTPYTASDFLYCKYYGLIPNNRLVTLRRFPIPVHDNMKAGGVHGDTELVPLAQAVTWFGEKTKNPLKSVLPLMSWEMPWKTLDAQDGSQDTVTMENVTSQDLIDLIGSLPGLKKMLGGADKIVRGLKMAGAFQGGNQSLIDQVTRMNEKLYEYQTKLYDNTGPKWNETYGGVNYITQTLIRDKVSSATAWSQATSKINFHYALKSIGGVKPRIALLDIISNFLSLTYMNMQWKGSFARFIPSPGATGDPGIDAQITQLMTQGRAMEGIRLAAATIAIQATAGVKALTTLKLDSDSITKIINGEGDNIEVATDKTGKNLTLDQLLSSVLGATDGYAKIAKKPFSMRSTLSGEPTGEWHLVVGNPMNPIATIGNLVCTNCTMEFDEELGTDDFPIGVTFTVSLKPAQPRDKYGMESMFNLGGGSLTEFFTKPPASTQQSLSLTNGDVKIGQTDNNTVQRLTGALATPEGANSRSQLSTTGDSYLNSKRRITLAYGQQYANMSMLPAYFMTDQFVANNKSIIAPKPEGMEPGAATSKRTNFIKIQ